MSNYQELGVRPVINAAAAQTMLGGSRMPPEVLAAMTGAASAFVHVPELHDRVGERLAHLTHNEAACVSCGAAAGVLLAVAACLTGEDLASALALPATDGLARTEVISFRGHWNGFLSAVRETGATLIEVPGTETDYEAAFTERTAAVLWFAGDFWGDDALPLEPTVRIAHAHGVPVIVDAADQIPAVENLWHYTKEAGADLAIFSGGKGLRGPQSSGMILGRADLIRACRVNSGPQHSIGRPAKVGKEEMLGLLAAVERAVALDSTAVHAGWSEIVDAWVNELGTLPAASVSRTERSHSGQPVPRAIVEFGSTETRDAVIAALWEMDPRIAVLPEGEQGIGLNPQQVDPPDAPLVSAALKSAVQRLT